MMRDWNCLCAASTEEAFDNIWCQFLRDYEQSPQLTSYLANTWLPHKKHFVDAWVQQSTHFGCITTSRAESSNSFLKRFLSSSTGSLLTVVRETVLSIEHQVNEIRKQISEDKCKRPVSCLDPLYDEVVYKISGYALTLVSHQVPTVMKPCTGKFARTMGLPCCHIICDRKQNNQRLLLSDFHCQWWLDTSNGHSMAGPVSYDLATPFDELVVNLRNIYDNASAHRKIEIRDELNGMVVRGPNKLLQEPIASKSKSKGRPKGSRNKNKTSTQRDPSVLIHPI